MVTVCNVYWQLFDKWREKLPVGMNFTMCCYFIRGNLINLTVTCICMKVWLHYCGRYIVLTER